MQNMIADVILFHEAGDTPVVRTPTPLSEEAYARRENLEDQEHEELIEALALNDPAKILQESLDKIYVSLGTLIETGLINAAILGWEELQRSNMAKINPETGKVTKNELGKILKPEGWQPVDWNAVIERSKRG